MDGATFIKRFREEAADEVTPYLWSDSLILRYLDEAQTEFCRYTEGIEDSTSSICSVTVPAGSGFIRLSPKIQKLRAVMLDGKQLDLLSVEDARARGIPTTDVPQGRPHSVVMLARGRAQITNAPMTDTVVRLDVFRLPLAPIETAQDEVEVHDMYAPTLMHYALHRAYSRPDPDTMDKGRADYFMQQFLAGCGRASREQGRLRKPAGATIFSW